MKFLVLALCVCAASAASVGQYKSYNAHSNAKVGASSYAAPSFAPVVKAEVRQSAAAPVPVAKNAHSDAEAEVVSSESKINDDGTFKNSFGTNNGIEILASGDLKKVGDANVLVISGRYRYTDADGTPYEFTYVADENGYHVKSDSLPVAPPVPEDIARAVEYVRQYGKPENDKY